LWAIFGKKLFFSTQILVHFKYATFGTQKWRLLKRSSFSEIVAKNIINFEKLGIWLVAVDRWLLAQVGLHF
jgi:hypothetical protein